MTLLLLGAGNLRLTKLFFNWPKLALLLCLVAYAFSIQAIEVPEYELAKGPLMPEEAFRFRSLDQGGGKYQLEWIIQPYYYLYQDKFAFATNNDRVSFEAQYSRNSQVYDDPFFGQLAIFRDYVTIDLTVFAPPNATADEIKVTYQGCWDGGICYPPETLTLPISSLALASTGTPQTNTATAKQATASSSDLNLMEVVTNQSDQRVFGKLLASGRVWLLIGIFYLAGLALAFTPCVFPTIPLISGIISRQAHNLNSIKGLAMMGVFVLSMSLTYTLAGVSAGLLGKNLQVILQQTWIIVVSALLFLFLAGAMFGLYTLQLPTGLQNRLYRISSKHNHGTYLGLAIMGVFSALIVGPCLTAPLAGILIYLSGKGDPMFGGVSLFALGLGMGTPLLLVGLFAGKILPKAGAWMNLVQHFFGFAMLFLTVWMLDRILADDLVLLLYGIVVIAFAVYLLQIAAGAAKNGKNSVETISRTMAIVLLVVGVVQLVGYSLGSNNLWQPLKVLQDSGGDKSVGVAKLPKLVVTTPAQLDGKLAELGRAGQPVLLKYEADWCVECRVIERKVFADSEIIARLANATVLTVDVTAVGDNSDQLLARYKLPGPPALVFYDATGNERNDLLLLGNITKERVLKTLSLL